MSQPRSGPSRRSKRKISRSTITARSPADDSRLRQQRRYNHQTNINERLQNPLSLLGLPTELWIMIYDYVIQTSELVSHRALNGLGMTTCSSRREWKCVEPGLMRTCKLMRVEMLESYIKQLDKIQPQYDQDLIKIRQRYTNQNRVLRPFLNSTRDWLWQKYRDGRRVRRSRSFVKALIDGLWREEVEATMMRNGVVEPVMRKKNSIAFEGVGVVDLTGAED